MRQTLTEDVKGQALELASISPQDWDGGESFLLQQEDDAAHL